MGGNSAESLYVVARAVDYLGLALFLGGLAFLAVLWPAGGQTRAARRIVAGGWVLGSVGTVAAIAFEAVWISGGPLTDALRWDVVSPVLDGTFGRVWFARALLWVLAGVVLGGILGGGERAARSIAWRVGAGAVGFGLLRTSGMTGHASEGRDLGLAQIADLVHLAGISLWIGGLVMLLVGVLPRRRPDELAAVVPGYSVLAMVSVGSIVVSGTVLALRMFDSVGEVFGTGYGRIFLIKLALFGVVMVAAQASKSWVARRLDFAVVLRGDAATVRPFAYSVAAETTVVIFVLVAASFLVTADPGR